MSNTLTHTRQQRNRRRQQAVTRTRAQSAPPRRTQLSAQAETKPDPADTHTPLIARLQWARVPAATATAPHPLDACPMEPPIGTHTSVSKRFFSPKI
jgi:hypothetical protein